MSTQISMNNIMSTMSSISYSKNNKYFKVNNGKRSRPIYNKKGKLTPTFRKLVLDGTIKELPQQFPFVFNTKTKRFVDKDSIFDKRHTQPVLKKKFKDFEVVNGIVKQKKQQVWSNSISVKKYKIEYKKQTKAQIKANAPLEVKRFVKPKPKTIVFKSKKQLKLNYNQFAYFNDTYYTEDKRKQIVDETNRKYNNIVIYKRSELHKLVQDDKSDPIYVKVVYKEFQRTEIDKKVINFNKLIGNTTEKYIYDQ